jgi:hypothetical protein
MKKEDLILIRENSIPNSLLKDIIENYEGFVSFFKKDIKYFNDEKFNKIDKFLKNEIKKTLLLYVIKINELCKMDTNKILYNSSIENISKFSIIKNIYNTENDYKSVLETTRIERFYEEKSKTIRAKKLHFIWVLNNFDGEIIFWKDYSIKPKEGTLIIFPSSWCFPYSEIMKYNETLYTIYGYVYENYKIDLK